MQNAITLSPPALKTLAQGGVFIPSPLALDSQNGVDEAYQRLLTLYYIKAGAKSVIPGAHTGEFALNDLSILDRWLAWVKEMVLSYGEGMILIAAIGGTEAMKQAELAAKYGYDLVMIAPTAFAGKSEREVVTLFETVASVIPTFAFELQRAIPGSHRFTPELWQRIFDCAYGAKGASFDTYRSLVMLEAAARSSRRHVLALFTGNDDRIVADFLGKFTFDIEGESIQLRYHGGLLGHFATDTHAAVRWVDSILHKRQTGEWLFELSEQELAHAVNRCNMALFDALGNFENSVWGVKCRLTSLGLLPEPICQHETGRPGQAEAIRNTYGAYPHLCDDDFVRENIDWMMREAGVHRR
jgi:hypothetical protein